jgi:hypothetical protein
MLSRLTLLLCAFALVFVAACGGSKGGSSSRSGGGGGGYDDDDEARPPRADELKETRGEAVSLTEENHKMAREIFELKNKMNLPTDE